MSGFDELENEALREEVEQEEQKKLKTLKDFMCPMNPDLAHADELRQEAIKWIKSIEGGIDNRVKTIFGTDLEEYEKSIVKATAISWIKHFFNITDEELR